MESQIVLQAEIPPGDMDIHVGLDLVLHSAPTDEETSRVVNEAEAMDVSESNTPRVVEQAINENVPADVLGGNHVELGQRDEQNSDASSSIAGKSSGPKPQYLSCLGNCSGH
jgi:hypothetical protein